jgi:hypothetical protein
MFDTTRIGSRIQRSLFVPAWQPGHPSERAQSTVEYALVLLGAAALALLVVSWVTGTDVVGRLFEAVFGRILRQAG